MTTWIKKHYIEIALVAIILFLILGGKVIKLPFLGERIVNDTITIHDTIPGDSIPYPVEVKVPNPIYVEVPVEDELPIELEIMDFLEANYPVIYDVVLDYYTHRFYEDTVRGKDMLAIYKATITQNRLDSLSIKMQNLKVTAITNTTIITPVKEKLVSFYVGGGLSSYPLGKFDLNANIGLIYKNNVFGLSKGFNTTQISYMRKISFKKKIL